MAKKQLYQVVKLEPTQMCWVVAHSEGHAKRKMNFDPESCFGCEDMVGMGTSEYYATEIYSSDLMRKTRERFPKEMEEVRK